MAKTGISDKTTGQTLTAAEFNTVKNTVDGNDDLRLAALQAAQAAQADATQALSDASDAQADATQAIADAAAAQATADAALPSATFLSQGNTLTNEITVNAYNKYYTRETGGTWSFTMAASGNVDKGFFQIELDQPASVSFSADWIQENSTAIDTSKLNIIRGYYNQADDMIYYVASTVTSQAGDITVPTLVSATVENAAPSNIVLTYDESLDEASTPANGDFTVSGGKSVTGVVVSGLTVTVTVDSPYINGDVITISYTAGVNPIQDAAGNDAANLTSESVTNNVGGSLPTTQSLDFDSGDNLRSSETVTLNTAGADNPFSVIAHVKSDAAQSIPLSPFVIENGTRAHVRVTINGSGDMIFALYPSTGTAGTTGAFLTQTVSSAGLLDNAWHGVGVSYDGSETTAGMKIFIDGVKQTPTATSNGTYDNLRSDGFIRIQRDQVGGGASAAGAGRIAQLAFYTSELSEANMNQATNLTTVQDLSSYGTPQMYIVGSSKTDQQANYTFTETGTVTIETDAPS